MGGADGLIQHWRLRLGEILRQARLDRRMTQAEVASEMAKLGDMRGRSQQTVSNWERAWVVPTLVELRALVRILAMDPKLLVEVLENGEQPA